MNAAARTCLAAAIFALAGPAAADIWGFVDEHGVAHVSSYQVHERYYLFKKEPPAPASAEATTATPEHGELAGLNGKINIAQRRQLAPLVGAIAKEHGLDAALLHAVITVESGYNAHARSPKGAAGLMQLMPDTAERYAVKNIWDPRENLRGGARYLRDLIAMFNADLSLALAAYNAGEAAVVQAGNRVPPYPETRSYVPRVLAHYARYRAQQVW
jgi:soluble lytic murein transglycosylase-like protein